MADLLHGDGIRETGPDGALILQRQGLKIEQLIVDGVSLAAGVSFGKVTGYDSGLTGDPTIKEKREAQARCTKYWAEHENEIRTKLNQPKTAPGAPPPGPDPKEPAKEPGMDAPK